MFAKVSMLMAALVVLLGIGWAYAIVIDGVNDFPPTALVDADAGDTESAPIDIGDVYVTYDADAIYIGYDHDHDGWTGVQVGIALVTISTAGGTTDPWAHQIGFGGMCLPDYIAYKDIDSDWDEWCIWTGTDWNRIPDVLNWVVSTTFDEIEFRYDDLGIDCTVFSQVFMELWVTQNGDTKGPLDLSYNDDLQLSTPGGTTWDITEPVIISCYHCIEIFGPSATENTSWGGIKRLYK
jgi:hypothetical protein